MIVEIMNNGRKLFVKCSYVGTRGFRFEVLEFVTLGQIKEFKDELQLAIEKFEVKTAGINEVNNANSLQTNR